MAFNVVFLDVDGVLNRKHDLGFRPLCDDLIKNLCKIVIECSAKIVISSTWKLEPEHFHRLQEKLEEHAGIDRDINVISRTPDLSKILLGNTYPRKNADLASITKRQVYHFALSMLKRVDNIS